MIAAPTPARRWTTVPVTVLSSSVLERPSSVETVIFALDEDK